MKLRILLSFFLLLRRSQVEIAILGVGVAAARGERDLILSPPLLGFAMRVLWGPRPFPSHRLIKKRLCGLFSSRERAVLVDNLEHMMGRRLLRGCGLDEEFVDPLHVVLEIETQKRIPALIYRRGVINKQLIRVVNVDIGAREPDEVSGEKGGEREDRCSSATTSTTVAGKWKSFSSFFTSCFQWE